MKNKTECEKGAAFIVVWMPLWKWYLGDRILMGLAKNGSNELLGVTELGERKEILYSDVQAVCLKCPNIRIDIMHLRVKSCLLNLFLLRQRITEDLTAVMCRLLAGRLRE